MVWLSFEFAGSSVAISPGSSRVVAPSIVTSAVAHMVNTNRPSCEVRANI